MVIQLDFRNELNPHKLQGGESHTLSDPQCESFPSHKYNSLQIIKTHKTPSSWEQLRWNRGRKEVMLPKEGVKLNYLQGGFWLGVGKEAVLTQKLLIIRVTEMNSLRAGGVGQRAQRVLDICNWREFLRAEAGEVIPNEVLLCISLFNNRNFKSGVCVVLKLLGWAACLKASAIHPSQVCLSEQPTVTRNYDQILF